MPAQPRAARTVDLTQLDPCSSLVGFSGLLGGRTGKPPEMLLHIGVPICH